MLVGVSRKLICDFLLVINSNFDVSLTVFEIGY